MAPPLLLTSLQSFFVTPATFSISAICIVTYAYACKNSVDPSRIALSYKGIRFQFEITSLAFVFDHQYWRGITATFSHLSLLHLVFNMTSLWAYSWMEVEVARP